MANEEGAGSRRSTISTSTPRASSPIVVGLPTNVAFDFDKHSVGDLAKHDDDSINGRLGLDFKLTDDVRVAVRRHRARHEVFGLLRRVPRLRRSFFASNTVATIPFDEEKLTSYEVGFKSTWAGGRTRLNGAAFYYDYKDSPDLPASCC